MFLGLGLVSAVCSFASSFVGAVSSAVCGFGHAIGSALSTALGMCKSIAGTVLGKLASGLLNPLNALAIGVLGPVLGPIVAKFIVAKIIEVATKMVTGMDNEKADEIGYRMEEAAKHPDWRQPESFESMKEYYDYLKAQIPDEAIDRDKLKEGKYYYEAIAVDAMAKEIGKTRGIQTPMEFFMEIGRSAMDVKEVEAIIAAYKSLGYDSVSLSDYLRGNLSAEETKNIRNALLKSLKQYYPEKSDADLANRLLCMKNCSKDDEFMAKESYKEALDDIKEHDIKSEYLKGSV